MKNIAVFASGSGTNAQQIIEYFINHPEIRVDLILSNNSRAYVLERAKKSNIDTFVFNRKQFYDSNFIIDLLIQRDISFVILAGFLWLVPPNLIKHFTNRIINIHPALLPKYGGKGMYGMNVHKAVIENGEPTSGISIHLVNEKYDEGKILFQASCKIEKDDTPEILASKIHKLEHEHYPVVIEKVVLGNMDT